MVPDETEREAYLILIVHGIGSNTEVQSHNKHDFDVSMNALIKGGYINSQYTFETVVIDWKTTVDESEMRQRMKKCMVAS